MLKKVSLSTHNDSAVSLLSPPLTAICSNDGLASFSLGQNHRAHRRKCLPSLPPSARPPYPLTANII